MNDELILDHCDLGIAYECMLACKMCFFWQNSPLTPKNIVPLEKWEQVLRQLREFKFSENFKVGFSGPGEPFLRPGMLDLVRCGRDLDLPIHVISNGYIIDESFAARIADSGLNSLGISLDSRNPQTHDLLRGRRGSLENALRAVDCVSRRAPQVEIGINTVISGINLPDIPDLVQWVETQDALRYINFQAVSRPFSFQPIGDDWFARAEFKTLWPQDAGLVNEVMDYLVEAKTRGMKIADEVGQLNVFRKYFLDPRAFIKQGRCNLSQRNILSIDPVGNVAICHLAGIAGNIREGQTLKQIMDCAAMREHRQNVKSCRKNCHLIVSCYYEEEIV